MKIYNNSRDAIFEELYQIALKDKNVILLTADTGALVFKEFKKNIPEQFYNVGVAEQNAISVAAGLAFLGKNVFIYGITNFITLRCFDQIRIDICSMNLPITILGMGTGYVYSEDGPTHHMLEDFTVMRTLPNMTVWSPSDYTMIANLAHIAYESKTPTYIRFDKGPFDKHYDYNHKFTRGAEKLRSGKDITLIATGVMLKEAFKVAEELEEYSFQSDVIDLYKLKPLNDNVLLDLIKDSNCIVTMEEHTIHGGLGSLISEFLHKHHLSMPLKSFGIPDVYRSRVYDRKTMRTIDRIDAHTMTKRIILGL